MTDEQRFPAWPLITAVVSDSQRSGSYTARVEYPNAPMRLLKRGDLQTLRREIISQVQRWTNDEWHKPVVAPDGCLQALRVSGRVGDNRLRERLRVPAHRRQPAG